MMISLIDRNQNEIRELCVRHAVRRLDLFGSAATHPTGSDSEDLDFLVEFVPMSPVEHADAFFGLQEDLQDLFGLPVDLIEHAPIRNPYFLDAIEQTKVLLYAAA